MEEDLEAEDLLEAVDDEGNDDGKVDSMDIDIIDSNI